MFLKIKEKEGKKKRKKKKKNITIDQNEEHHQVYCPVCLKKMRNTMKMEGKV